MFKRAKTRLDRPDLLGSTQEDEATIGRYFDQYGDEIIASSEKWHSVNSSVRSFVGSEQVQAGFRRGVESCFRSQSDVFAESRVESESQRLLKVFPAYLLACVRRETREFLSPVAAPKAMNRVTRQYPGTGVPHILTGGYIPQFELGKLLNNVANDMRDADGYDTKVLHGLCDEFLTTPQKIDELRDFYVDDAQDVYPLLSALRTVVANDWYKSDQDKSILRKHVALLKGDPSLHISNFCEAVAQGETGASSREMVRYALRSSRVVDTPANIAHHLRDSSEIWSEIPDLQEEFNAYADQMANNVDRVFGSVAGPSDGVLERNSLTDTEFLSLTSQIQVHFATNRQEHLANRKGRKRESREYGNKDEVQRGLKLAEHVLKSQGPELLNRRNIAVVRNIQGRGAEVKRFENNNVEELLQEFELKEGTKLYDDMRITVEYLRDTKKIFPGAKRLQADSLKLQGKSYRLWRFAPDKEPGLKVASENRFYRIVYAVINGELMVKDILSHPEFDKAYPG